MPTPQTRALPLNPLNERSLLSENDVAEWAGFDIGWIEAPETVTFRGDGDGPTGLAMLDTGRARAEFRFGRRSYTYDIDQGCIGLFPDGGHADYCQWHCDNVRRIILHFDHARLDDPVLAEQLHRTPLRRDLRFRDQDLTAVLRAMVREAVSGCPNGPLFAESLSIGVAMRLQRRATASQSAVREQGKLTGTQTRNVAELVRNRLHTTISIGELARITGFSRTQFVRLFKNTLGCTPYQYILRARLDFAGGLVADSDLSLADIAELAGFSSQSHMTATFARVRNITPGHLRRLQAGHSS